MKAITSIRGFRKVIGCLTSLIVFGGLIPSAGCQSSKIKPVVGIPITGEKRGIYKVQHTFIYYHDDTLVIEGELRLAPGAMLAPDAHFDVKIFDASGDVLGAASAKLDRNEKTYPGDMRLNASFTARIQVPRAEIGHIEAHYSASS